MKKNNLLDSQSTFYLNSSKTEIYKWIMKQLLLLLFLIPNILMADGNPFADGYHQDTNPFADGYIQGDNPFADGYIQDTNPFADGYVQDKGIFEENLK